MNTELEAFDDVHGEVVLNALAVYAERMRETAAEAEGASKIPEPAAQPGDGTTIPVRPTAGGFAHRAGMFTEAADKADAARAAYETLAGRNDDDDARQPEPAGRSCWDGDALRITAGPWSGFTGRVEHVHKTGSYKVRLDTTVPGTTGKLITVQSYDAEPVSEPQG
jgi:transcription antitermination factor NusG